MSCVVIFVFCSLLSSARLILDARGLKTSENMAKRSDLRFAALKAALPPRGVVGYVGEPGTSALGDYYLAQYALAPVVVNHSPNHSLVIGNFPTSSSIPAPPGDLRLAHDYGDGVLLYIGNVNIDQDSNK